MKEPCKREAVARLSCDGHGSDGEDVECECESEREPDQYDGKQIAGDAERAGSDTECEPESIWKVEDGHSEQPQ